MGGDHEERQIAIRNPAAITDLPETALQNNNENALSLVNMEGELLTLYVDEIDIKLSLLFR